MLRKLLCCAGACDAHDVETHPVKKESGAKPPTPRSSHHRVENQPRNLWKEAYDKLEPKCREIFASDDSPPTAAIIDEIIKFATTEDKRGHEYPRYIKQIVGGALQFKTVVDGFVSFDPTGHASIAWSVVSLGLKMAQNDIDRRETILEASRYLASLLAKYAIIEEYRDATLPTINILEDALVRAYGCILQYAAAVKKTKKETPLTRVKSSITALVDDPYTKMQTDIANNDAQIFQLNSLTSEIGLLRQGESLLFQLRESHQTAQHIAKRILSRDELDILEWLSKVPYSNAQNMRRRNRESGTGDWFLNTSQYRDWKKDPGDIFWLHGVAGCGKSVLCSRIIDDIQNSIQNDSTIAYWYFEFSTDASQSVANMIRSLLRQLSKYAVHSTIYDLYKKHAERNSEPNDEELTESLTSILSRYSGQVFLVLDALDECPERPNRRERSMLLKVLLDAVQEFPSKLHILVTGRAESDIKSRLGSGLTMDLEKGLEKDTERFIYSQIRNFVHAEPCKGKEWRKDVETLIIDRLLGIPERRFRWAALQIQRLESCDTQDDIYQELATIPPDLESSYLRALQEIQPHKKKVAQEILMSLALSIEPLRLDTVAALVSIPDPQSVIRICTTALITVDISDNTVRLAHFSVKEFLVVACEKDHEWYQFSVKSGHKFLGHKMIDLLLGAQDPEALDRAIMNPLSLEMYAALYWQVHVMESIDENIDPNLQKKIDFFFGEDGSDSFLTWRHMLKKSRIITHFLGLTFYVGTFPPPLFYASRFGLLQAVEKLLSADAGPADRLPPPLDVLHALPMATYGGYPAVFERLILNCKTIPQTVVMSIIGFMTNPDPGWKKSEAIMQILWNRGAFLDRSQSTRVVDVNIMIQVAQNHSLGAELMKFFLDRQEDTAIPITDKLVEAVMENLSSGAEIMKLLFYQLDKRLHVPLCNISKVDIYRDNHMLKLILQWSKDVPVCPETVARRNSFECMRILFETRGEKLEVTEALLAEAAENESDSEIFRFLLETRELRVLISKHVFVAAAANHEYGLEMMTWLLDTCGPDYSLGEEVVLKAVVNVPCGLPILQLFVQRKQPGFIVTAKALAKAAKRDYRLFKLLMHHGGSNIPLTEEIMYSMALNEDSGISIMEYLQSRGSPISITEQVLEALTWNDSHGLQMFRMILERYPATNITPMVWGRSCAEPRFMNMLLDYGKELPPIADMIQIIADSGSDGGQALGELLDRKLINVDDHLVEAMSSRNPDAMALLLEKIPDLPITERILLDGAGSTTLVRTVLDRQDTGITVTENIMMSVIKTRECVEITKLLLQLDPNMPITEDMLCVAARKGGDDELELFRLLLKQNRPLNLQAIWENIWEDRPSDYQILASNSLIKYTTPQLSAGMLETKHLDWGRQYDGGFDELILFCVQKKVSILSTTRLAEIVLERSSEKVLKSFLQTQPDFRVTAQYIEAVERNPRIDQTATRKFLTSWADLEE